jgi:hypothetical protein
VTIPFDEVMNLGNFADRKALLGHVATRIEIGKRFQGSVARSLVLLATLRGDKVGVPRHSQLEPDPERTGTTR